MRDRIKFYSIYDMSIGFYLEPLKKKLDKFDDTIEYDDINDILEFENIKKFIYNNIFHKDWTEQEIEKYKNMNFLKVIGKFIKKITDENIIAKISEVDTVYLEDFWELFENCKLYKRISKNTFKNILDLEEGNINYILYHKSIVLYYDDIIKDYLISHNDDSVELYLSEYFEEKENNQKPMFFPPSLTKEEKEEQLELYITEDLKKFNYFQLILKSFSCQELNLTPILKNRVKKIYENLIRKYFKSNTNYFTYGFEVKFQENQFIDKIFTEKKSDKKLIIQISYSLNWILENLDYPTLLNNFIYLFEFVNNFFIFSYTDFEKDFSFVDYLRQNIKEAYKIRRNFEFKEMKFKMDLYAYFNILKKHNIRLENVLEWFFKEYLLIEFGVKNFTINLPSENLTYLEKCKCIIGEIERVLKQFALYVDYNEIDTEILVLLSEQTKFESIKSLLNEKYYYINPQNEKMNNILHYLFSNQSDLRFIKNINKNYENFIQIIAEEKICKSMLAPYQLPIVEFLLKEDIILEDKEENFIFDLKLIILLKELYEKEVLCNNYLKEFKKEIEFLKNKNMIYCENTVFAKKESDYLNYLLKSNFSNSLELRNKYAHGTHSLNEKQHLEDYFKFLEVLILIIIKINEEFCLYDKLKNKNNI